MAPYRGGLFQKSKKAPGNLSKVEKKNAKHKEKIVARELNLVRMLSGNDVRVRNKAVHKLKRWLAARLDSSYDFTEHDFLRIWKGLFFCVWMSDKPLVQEDLCETIAALFDVFGNKHYPIALLFYKTFLKTLSTEWFGIDQHRIDKFLMFIRRVTRGILRCIHRLDWSIEAGEALDTCLSGEGGLFCPEPPPEARMALGLQLHLVECWLEEIAKISDAKISEESMTVLTLPFAKYMCSGKESRLCNTIMKSIFTSLIEQTDIGIEYQEKAKAWFHAGMPGGNVDAMQKVEISDDEENSDEEMIAEDSKKKVLDPRAGFVDAVLKQLPVDAKGIASKLQELILNQPSTKVNRTRIKDLISSFNKLEKGEYPFKLKSCKLPNDQSLKMPKIEKAASELLEFEKKLENEEDDEQLKGLNKRQKRRMLAKQRKKRLRSDSNEAPSSTPTKKSVAASKPITNKPLKKKIIDSPINKTTSAGKKSLKTAETYKITPVNKIKKKDANVTAVKNQASTSGFTVTPVKSESKSVSSRLKVESSDIQVSPSKRNKTKKTASPNGDISNETRINIPLIKKSKLKSDMSKTPPSKISSPKTPQLNCSISKRVSIALSKNTSHSVMDYFKSVRQSPEIPYSGEKKPVKTSLKPNAMPSPVNPFFVKSAFKMK